MGTGFNVAQSSYLVPNIVLYQVLSVDMVDIEWMYGMFHVSWTNFSFNRTHLGIVLPYTASLWLITLFMCTHKWYRIDIQCHKQFHLKPKAAINYTEISSLICKTILIFNEHNFQYNSLYAKFTDIKNLPVVQSLTVKFRGNNCSLMTSCARWLVHGTEIMTYAETVSSWFLLNLKCFKLRETYYRNMRHLLPFLVIWRSKACCITTFSYIITLVCICNVWKNMLGVGFSI